MTTVSAYPPSRLYRRLAELGCDYRRTSFVVDPGGIRLGRLVWLRRGWPDLYRQLQQQLPRMREFT